MRKNLRLHIMVKSVLLLCCLACTYNTAYAEENCTLQAYATGIDPTCAGNFQNGSATATPYNGGTPPYSYYWSNGGETQTIYGLTAGVYWVTVTDAQGCTASAYTILYTQGQINYNILTGYETCPGAGDGIAVVDSTWGGTPPYSYIWSNGATGPIAANLHAGTYYVTITDATQSCSVVAQAKVEIHPEGVWVMSTHTDVTCYGYSDGTAHAGGYVG